MAFTFGEDLNDDVDFVRFHSGDTVEAESLLSDALITSMVTKYGLNGAVIQAIEFKIARMSQPNFEADWLKVDLQSAVKSLRVLLAEKRTLLNVSAITASFTHAYRADSTQTEEPDFTDGRP